MAHTLFTPEQAAASTLAALRGLSVLPRTVRQDFSTEFVAGKGQTINVLGPVTAGEAHVYTKAKRDAREDIEFNDLTQTWVPVKLEDQVYNATRLPDDWATFTLSSLEQQVLIPQAESVVDKLSAPLTTLISATAAASPAVPDLAADGSNLFVVLAALRKVLNARHVPTQDRTLSVGPGVAAAMLQNDTIVKANESGTTDALREATIGRLFGFEIVEAVDLAEDFMAAYHRDAFAFVTRPSRVPEGVAHGAAVAQDGFSLRHIMHYNPIKLEDQSIVDAFHGAAVLDPLRAVSAKLAAA